MLSMWTLWYGPIGFAGMAIVGGGSTAGVGDGVDIWPCGVWEMLNILRPWYGPIGFSGTTIIFGESIGGIGDGIDGACSIVDD